MAASAHRFYDLCAVNVTGATVYLTRRNALALSKQIATVARSINTEPFQQSNCSGKDLPAFPTRDLMAAHEAAAKERAEA